MMQVKDQRAGSYSGGMRRRLSVAISTIGDPKVVFMDEPTTGMDPLNRRYVWAFIEKFKKDRVVILTTHSMEEADILGDEIAIMATAKLRALGTPIHLKNKFGAGYRLSVVCDEANVTNVKMDLLARVPGLRVEDDSAGAIMFTIPKESLSEVPALIRHLESNTGCMHARRPRPPHAASLLLTHGSWGMWGGSTAMIKEWGVSQTTLEDVFLLLIRQVNPADAKKARRLTNKEAAAQ
jgi:ABC-type multidrug transport system ATPase subunit